MISTSFLSFLLISCSPVMAAPDSATKAAATPPITVGAVVYHEWTHFEAPTALGAITKVEFVVVPVTGQGAIVDRSLRKRVALVWAPIVYRIERAIFNAKNRDLKTIFFEKTGLSRGDAIRRKNGGPICTHCVPLFLTFSLRLSVYGY